MTLTEALRACARQLEKVPGSTRFPGWDIHSEPGFADEQRQRNEQVRRAAGAILAVNEPDGGDGRRVPRRRPARGDDHDPPVARRAGGRAAERTRSPPTEAASRGLPCTCIPARLTEAADGTEEAGP